MALNAWNFQPRKQLFSLTSAVRLTLLSWNIEQRRRMWMVTCSGVWWNTGAPCWRRGKGLQQGAEVGMAVFTLGQPRAETVASLVGACRGLHREKSRRPVRPNSVGVNPRAGGLIPDLPDSPPDQHTFCFSPQTGRTQHSVGLDAISSPPREVVPRPGPSVWAVLIAEKEVAAYPSACPGPASEKRGAESVGSGEVAGTGTRGLLRGLGLQGGQTVKYEQGPGRACRRAELEIAEIR
ncbi:hypothetical protein EYF80_009508 [Liparis tanakae]|uniref:Uncharacterized protein n=1 Tax=Liparis tanakae TaxID=230148 RepID=A0A4Z2ISM3_9TELE|nr:hypothetical protein EYF80_009508 [Liparis tanakae]